MPDAQFQLIAMDHTHYFNRGDLVAGLDKIDFVKDDGASPCAFRESVQTNTFLFTAPCSDGIHGGVQILANARWEKFAQSIASGENGAAAYRTCYGARGAGAAANASRLIRNDKVRRRVAELRQQAAGVGSAEAAKTVAKAATRTVLTLARKRELLFALATSRKLKPEQRMRAIELDAKLAGELKGDAATASMTVNNHVLTEERRAELIQKHRAALEWGIENSRAGAAER